MERSKWSGTEEMKTTIPISVDRAGEAVRDFDQQHGVMHTPDRRAPTSDALPASAPLFGCGWNLDGAPDPTRIRRLPRLRRLRGGREAADTRRGSARATLLRA